jgi:excisionase family DNA binding protein
MSKTDQENQENGRTRVIDDDHLLKPEDAAALLGIKRSKMYTLIKDGAIDCVRVGRRGTRVTRPALRRYVARCEQGY